jgi:hypothetical protein
MFLHDFIPFASAMNNEEVFVSINAIQCSFTWSWVLNAENQRAVDK